MKAARTSATRSPAEDAATRRALMRWYRAHGRHDLPWRLTRDPYAVLVSEVMLQQTQVGRVIPYYTDWLERWPTIASLAAASPADVIRAWSGLGYNRRGLALHRLAVAVESAGGLPHETSELRKLPGIGPYTANAVQSFAREQPTAVVETNIARLLARLFAGAVSARDVSPAAIQSLAETFLPTGYTRHHNLALMDLGATVCTARNPDCVRCPVVRRCAWQSAGAPPAAAIVSPTPRFETTARFARGRIIEALCVGRCTTSVLVAMLPDPHRARCLAYLDALARDGLVVRLDGDIWSLPSRVTAG